MSFDVKELPLRSFPVTLDGARRSVNFRLSTTYPDEYNAAHMEMDMKKAAIETVEKLDTIPEHVPLIVNLCIAGFVCFAHGGALLIELTCETEQVDSIKPLASITLPLACLVIISSLLAFKWLRARRVMLGVHAAFLTVGAIAIVLWATGILFKGIPKGSNFAWTPGIMSGLCVYSFYLLRRTVLVKCMDYTIIKYLHVIIFVFVFSLDIGVFGKLIATSSSIHGDFLNEQAEEIEDQYGTADETTSEEGKHILRMSINDSFVVENSEEWEVYVQRKRNLHFADVVVKPKKGKIFSMHLHFRRDTPDMARLNSADKIKKFVMSYSEQYMQQGVKKKIEFKELKIKGWYGWYLVLPDSKLDSNVNTPEGEYKYMTIGMVRLSSDSVLMFVIMTNELDTPEYKKLLDFTASFIKNRHG